MKINKNTCIILDIIDGHCSFATTQLGVISRTLISALTIRLKCQTGNVRQAVALTLL